MTYKINKEETPRWGVIYRYAFPHGKNYVGQTWNLPARIRDHKHKNKQLVDKKIKQYDLDAEKDCQIIMEGMFDQDGLDTLEVFWMGYYNAHISQNGYNILWRAKKGASFGELRHRHFSEKYNYTEHGRICSKCLEFKSWDSFGLCKANKSTGRKSECKECRHKEAVERNKMRTLKRRANQTRTRAEMNRDNWNDPALREKMLAALARGRTNSCRDELGRFSKN